ncbi:prepilin peptidase [Paenibacillus sp. PL91]|uniref:prepilin peptidase n=1 Tax=Paenibacillus sp. PL91 TaxID=2729538 RepID=UPI00145F5594|nr:A24 family peptidase [Paenibacillus sp. PL91]MBC9203694.1 prepilin peptidase [Paenibacillus sp. PL91]
MITTAILCTCGIAIGLWLGGWINSFSKRYTTEGIDTYTPVLPVRILAALAFCLIAAFVKVSIEWVIALPFVAALLTASVCDWRHMIIPDKIIIPGIFLVACLRIFISPLPYWDYALAAFLGGMIFFCFKLIGRLLVKEDVVGDGDIKLLLLTGFVLGLKLTLLSFLVFCFVGTLIGIYQIVKNRKYNETILPFGPVISGATYISYIWGSDFIRGAYTHLLY